MEEGSAMSDEHLDGGPLTEGAPAALDRERDEELSALVDGQLDPEREERLRAEVASDSRLSRRLEDFERVNAALRALPPVEHSQQRLSHLRDRVLAQRPAGAGPAATVGRLRRALRSASGPTWGALAALAASGVAALVLAQLLGPESGGAPEHVALEQELERELADLADEDIGVALEFDTLSDYELVEDLELLELLEALSEGERS
jgi:hypothetical protein